jgi:predicted DNA-binding protein with PD1-like motif
VLKKVVGVVAVLGAVALGLARAQGEGPTSRVVGPVAGAAPQVLALRLRPGADLRAELLRVTRERGLEAAWVSTCVGSLTKVTLRYADQPAGTTLEGHFEIVSLVGTVSTHGSHLHLSVSDGEGRTIGGHLLDGSAVYTTAEVVLLSSPDLRFTRPKDEETTYGELSIETR